MSIAQSSLEIAFDREGDKYPILTGLGVRDTVRDMLRCVDGQGLSFDTGPVKNTDAQLKALQRGALSLNDETRVAFRSFVSRYSDSED